MTAPGAGDPPITRAQVELLADLSTGAGRRREGACLLEGAVLLREALQAGLVPRLVAVSPAAAEASAEAVAAARAAGAPVVVLADRAAARLSARDHAPGLLAAVPLPPPWDGALPAAGPALLVGLCGVQDPGNVGTLLRSSLAFGAAAVLLAPGTADAHGPKVVRASAGAALRLPCAAATPDEMVARAAEAGLVPCAATSRPDEAPRPAGPTEGLPERCLLLLGHETRGLPELPGARAVRVPQSPAAESLNVAMAGSILLSGWYAAHGARAHDAGPRPGARA